MHEKINFYFKFIDPCLASQLLFVCVVIKPLSLCNKFVKSKFVKRGEKNSN